VPTISTTPTTTSPVSPRPSAGAGRKPLLIASIACGFCVVLVAAGWFFFDRVDWKEQWATINSQLAAANAQVETPETGSAPGAAVPTGTVSLSGTYSMKGSTRNVADSGQTQDQTRTGSLEIVEQPGGTIAFSLNAALVLDEASGNVHTGDLEGEVEIHNGEAVYVDADENESPGKCGITMNFAPDRIELKQEQSCGFGTGVDASGTYVKVNSEVPKLPKQQ